MKKYKHEIIESEQAMEAAEKEIIDLRDAINCYQSHICIYGDYDVYVRAYEPEEEITKEEADEIISYYVEDIREELPGYLEDLSEELGDGYYSVINMHISEDPFGDILKMFLPERYDKDPNSSYKLNGYGGWVHILNDENERTIIAPDAFY